MKKENIINLSYVTKGKFCVMILTKLYKNGCVLCGKTTENNVDIIVDKKTKRKMCYDCDSKISWNDIETGHTSLYI